MKSQDILLLLKLSSLAHPAPPLLGATPPLPDAGPRVMQARTAYYAPHPLQAPQSSPTPQPPEDPAPYTMRALADSTGISKSEVSMALQRCYETDLAKPDRINGLPRVHNCQLFPRFLVAIALHRRAAPFASTASRAFFLRAGTGC